MSRSAECMGNPVASGTCKHTACPLASAALHQCSGTRAAALTAAGSQDIGDHSGHIVGGHLIPAEVPEGQFSRVQPRVVAAECVAAAVACMVGGAGEDGGFADSGGSQEEAAWPGAAPCGCGPATQAQRCRHLQPSMPSICRAALAEIVCTPALAEVVSTPALAEVVSTHLATHRSRHLQG